MPTCGSNFDALPPCDYHHLYVVYPPLPHRYSNIEICKKSLSSRSKHFLFPKNHSLPSDLLTKNHLVSLPKITHSLTLVVHANRIEEDSSSVQLWQEDSLTHSHRAMLFASLEVTRICMLEIVHANRAEEDQDYCSSIQPLQVD